MLLQVRAFKFPRSELAGSTVVARGVAAFDLGPTASPRLVSACLRRRRVASRDAAAVSAEFAERYADLSDELGLEMGLRAVGVTAEDVEKLANDAMLQQRLLPNNPREVTLDDARALYTAAL